MRAIAKEFNQSETTFLVRPTRPGATWRLRSFTPIGVEVLGAGHNAMGAWIWLADSGRLPAGEEGFSQQIGDEVLPVRVTRQEGKPSVVSMGQSAPVFGGVVGDRDALAAALGLSVAELAERAVAQTVSTGAGHLLVPLGDRSAVDRAAPDPARLAAVLRDASAEGCYVYSRDPLQPEAGSVAYARFFNPTVGIAEDPATGTAAGPWSRRSPEPASCRRIRPSSSNRGSRSGARASSASRSAVSGSASAARDSSSPMVPSTCRK
jgi:PhzF family phenazine biosynthesis protein